MRKIIHFILKLLLWGISGNLNTIYGNPRIEEALLTGTISIGATKEEIKSIIGEPPFSFCIYRLSTQDGIYELWDFSPYKSSFCGGNWSINYALIFKNDKLIEIRKVNSIDDLHLP